MILTVAYMSGEDIKSEDCRTLVLICLSGHTVAEIAAEVGVQILSAGTRKAIISAISKQTVGKINKFFGVKLLTRFGTKGIIKIGTLVPIFGGVLGGGISATIMNWSGNLALKTFVEEKDLQMYTGREPPCK